MPAIFPFKTKKKKTKKAKKTNRCLWWNWKSCKVRKAPKVWRKSGGKLIGGALAKNMAGKRKGKFKLNKWAKGALAAVAPSVAAIGYGAIKKLLKKNTGYSDIYS